MAFNSVLIDGVVSAIGTDMEDTIPEPDQCDVLKDLPLPSNSQTCPTVAGWLNKKSGNLK
jgi:hypothetical protein